MYWFCKKSRHACVARGVPDIAVIVTCLLPPTFCGLLLTKRTLSCGAIQRPSTTRLVSVTTTPGGGTIGNGTIADIRCYPPSQSIQKTRQCYWRQLQSLLPQASL